MKSISDCQVAVVVGGGSGSQAPVVSRGVELCKGLSDSTSVKITVENTASVGIGSLNGGAVETMTFELTCGELRKAAKS